MMPTKPGGGNKPEPYIPAGNGEHSGEYTDKSIESKQTKQTKRLPDPNCRIRNKIGLFNPKRSKLVGKVNHIIIAHWGNKVPTKYKPNSVVKKIINGLIVEERYYDEKGETYLEIHYTNHGNPKTHPKVPHLHRSRYVDGKYKHAKWEEFQ